MFLITFILISFIGAVQCGTIVSSTSDRNVYISQAISWFPESENNIENADMFNGPPNPYGLKNFQTLECDFVEPDANDPVGGTTPKFYCEFEYDGEKVQLKIKYDQQYNPLSEYGRGNPEVYTSLISQRVLWATGFGSDQSVPINVVCRNCPLEPWTYIQVMQGYDTEDVLSGWIDMKLIESGRWNTKVPKLNLPSAIAYIKLNKYYDGDEIDYLDANGTQHRGYFWPEMYSNPTVDATQATSRDALSVIAAFLSYCDNFDENQGFICLDIDSAARGGVRRSAAAAAASITSTVSSDKSKCEGVPLIYIHDTGGTLGYGWNLRHKNFWPNYMDLNQWLEVNTWGDVPKCEVYVNGIPGCSWRGNLPVTEAGRSMAARLLGKITEKQLTDLFTAARSNLMRNDSIADWVTGFQTKLQRDVLGQVCV